MPIKSPPPFTKVDQLNENQLREVISGLLSSDPVELKATVYRHLHPNARMDHQLVKAEGRWNIWRILYANSALFDTKHKARSISFDQTKLKAVAVIDQHFKPRVPLRDWLLPEVAVPTVVEMCCVQEPDQGVLIKEIVILTSTDILAGIPPLHWAHDNLLKPISAYIARTIFDGIQFGVATRVFAAKQLNI